MGRMNVQTTEKYYSFEEYLELEEAAEFRCEFHDGEIIPVESATDQHAAILWNAHFALQKALQKKKGKCRGFDSSLKVRFEEYNHAVYPDAMIVCGEQQYYEGRKDVITNPTLIVEVLSPSTASYDRGEKFAKYRSLPSFKEYVLIWQTQPKIETWFKMEENIWRISHATGKDASIRLFSLEEDIALEDIYYLIEEFEPEVQPKKSIRKKRSN